MKFSAAIYAAAAVGLGAVMMNPSARAADAEGWVKLFDGKTLEGWKKYNGQPIEKGWVAQDGTLTLKEGGGGDIITTEQFGDFELEFEWKIQPGGNSGVMYRVKTGDPAPYFSGPEFQILDDAKHRDGKNPKTAVGSLYALVAAEDKMVNPPGEWNKGKILLKNNHLEHWVNGKQVIEIEMHSDQWKELVQNSKFAAWKPFGQSEKGHICLQDHGDPVSYRNLRIRKLED